MTRDVDVRRVKRAGGKRYVLRRHVQVRCLRDMGESGIRENSKILCYDCCSPATQELALVEVVWGSRVAYERSFRRRGERQRHARATGIIMICLKFLNTCH